MPGDDLRALFREVPSPVGVVTVALAGEAAGLTVDSFVSLSVGPAARRDRARTTRGAARAAPRGGRLRDQHPRLGQEHLAQHFARGVPPIAHWTGIETTPGELGAPLIDGALGWVECRLAFEREVGDHTLFVGEAISVRRGPGREALVHLRRAYT